MPVTDLILWQNVPVGARVDVSVTPIDGPILADGLHTSGTTLVGMLGIGGGAYPEYKPSDTRNR